MDLTNLLYLATIADNIHVSFAVITALIGALFLVFGLLYLNCYFTDDFGNARKFKRRSVLALLLLGISTSIFLLSPDEDDSLILLSGTVVGAVMDTTNTIDEVPEDITRFLRCMIQKEANMAKQETRERLEMLTARDSLQEFNKEELIEIVEALQGI